MITITILPDSPGSPTTQFRAVAGKRHSVGKTAGQALDALTAQLDTSETGTMLIVQNLRPDQFFSAHQQQRLEELMARWKTAQDVGTALSPQEQAELEALVEAEVQAAGERARAMLRELSP